MKFDEYNREERYLCAHLFRLLHEPANNHSALRSFLGTDADIAGARVLCEVALIRDAYYARRSDPMTFMDSLTRILMEQEEVTECRVYSKLPPDLNTPHVTHPKQIRHKGDKSLRDEEPKVYAAMQAMFNAKPDLAVCYGDQLIVYEAKFTLGFDAAQLERTHNIAEVWRTLLFKDLGFDGPPSVEVRTIGMARYSPDVSWEDVLSVAQAIYPPQDRSRQAFEHAVTSFGQA